MFALTMLSWLRTGRAFAMHSLLQSETGWCFLEMRIGEPTGNPSLVKPQGMLAAGCCVRLNGKLNGVHCIHALPSSPIGESWPASNAGVATEGVRRKSYRSMNRRI